MKKFVFLAAMLFAMASCGNRETAVETTEPVEVDTVLVDVDTVVVDAVEADTLVVDAE